MSCRVVSPACSLPPSVVSRALSGRPIGSESDGGSLHAGKAAPNLEQNANEMRAGRRGGWPASLTSCSGAIIYFNSAARAPLCTTALRIMLHFLLWTQPKCRIRPEYISPPFRSALGSQSASASASAPASAVDFANHFNTSQKQSFCVTCQCHESCAAPYESASRRGLRVLNSLGRAHSYSM